MICYTILYLLYSTLLYSTVLLHVYVQRHTHAFCSTKEGWERMESVSKLGSQPYSIPCFRLRTKLLGSPCKVLSGPYEQCNIVQLYLQRPPSKPLSAKLRQNNMEAEERPLKRRAIHTEPLLRFFVGLTGAQGRPFQKDSNAGPLFRFHAVFVELYANLQLQVGDGPIQPHGEGAAQQAREPGRGG